MNTFLIFLALLAVPSFAKLDWTINEEIKKKVNEALKYTEYDIHGNSSVVELGTISGSNKMIALCQTTKKSHSQPAFFYLPLIIDAEERINFSSGSDPSWHNDDTKASANHFVYSRFAFKFVWQRTVHYYDSLRKIPRHAPRAEILDPAYGKFGIKLMACKMEDKRVLIIHATGSSFPNYFFTIRLAVGKEYEVLHTSTQYDSLYDVQRKLFEYMQVPVQWAEPWRKDSKSLLQVLSENDQEILVSQLVDATKIETIVIEKAKRVRGDFSKIAAVCRHGSSSIYILAIVTASAEFKETFNLNYIYPEAKDDEHIEQVLQEYLSQALPFTSDWKDVKETSSEVEKIEKGVKEVLATMYDPVNTCKVVKTKNAGSAYVEKAAIVCTEEEKTDSPYGKYVYVAWTENNGKMLIKSIGPMVLLIQSAEDIFNFYGISPLAYTESKFENGVGWFGKDQFPKFIEAAMSSIMNDVSKLRTNAVGACETDNTGDWLQDVGRISTEKLREGEQHFSLKVKSDNNEGFETIRVKFVHENYIEIFEG